MDPERKTVLVTGGTRGVGAATARLAAARGLTACINYQHDEAGALAVAGRIRNDGGKVHLFRADIGREDDVVRLFSDVDALGRLTALVCNARAPVTRLPIEHLDAAMWASQLDTAVLGTALCIREAVRRMAHRNGGQGGAIVLASPPVQGANARDSMEEAVLGAAREALVTSLSASLARDQIRINAVRPASARASNWSGGRTNRTDRAVGPMAMELGPYADEAAKQILWLVSEEADRTTGSVVEVAFKE